MRWLPVAGCLLSAVVAQAQTVTFSTALDRALEVRGIPAPQSEIETISFRKQPTVRAETGLSTAQDLNLITQNLTRFDAITALITVDYPLLDGGSAQRQLAAARTSQQLVRLRALAEADEVFRETLDAFARLAIAEQRLEMLRDSAMRARSLRERSTTMLEAGQISNAVAAQWQDQALVTESLLVELELDRLDAETRLKQLMGDTSPNPIHVTLDGTPPSRRLNGRRPAAVERAALEEEQRRIALQDALALRRPQLMMSGFGGVANVDDGTFGLYGLRFSLSLPMFDAAAARRLAEAKLEVEEAERARSVIERTSKNRADLLRVAIDATEKRIALLLQALDVARQREASVIRLVRAGVRPEADLADATSSVARRESDLVALRVERWKLQQQLAYFSP